MCINALRCLRRIPSRFFGLFTGVLIPVAVLIKISTDTFFDRAAGLHPSLADVMLSAFAPMIVSLILLPCAYILMLNIQKNDYTCNVIVRQRSKQHIWLQQAVTAFIVTLAAVLSCAIAAVLLGSFMVDSWMNWQLLSGVYAAVNRTVTSQFGFWQVLWLVCVSNFLLIYVTLLAGLLADQLTSKKTAGLLCMIAVLGLNMVLGTRLFPFNSLYLRYSNFYTPPSFIGGVLAVLAAIVLLLVIGWYTASRKDYL